MVQLTTPAHFLYAHFQAGGHVGAVSQVDRHLQVSLPHTARTSLPHESHGEPRVVGLDRCPVEGGPPAAVVQRIAPLAGEVMKHLPLDHRGDLDDLRDGRLRLAAVIRGLGGVRGPAIGLHPHAHVAVGVGWSVLQQRSRPVAQVLAQAGPPARHGERRCRPGSSLVARGHQVSPNGRASSSNVHAERGWATRNAAVAATSSGLTKKASGLSGRRWRVRGRSTTPSITISETWMPAGPRCLASDSASERCAALAWANAAVRAAPRRDAGIVRWFGIYQPPLGIAGTLKMFERAIHMSVRQFQLRLHLRACHFELRGIPTLGAGAVIGQRFVEHPGHRSGIADIALPRARIGQRRRELARRLGRTGQQRDGVAVGRKSARERGAVPGTDPGDHAHRFRHAPTLRETGCADQSRPVPGGRQALLAGPPAGRRRTAAANRRGRSLPAVTAASPMAYA